MTDFDVLKETLSVEEILYVYQSLRKELHRQLQTAKEAMVELWRENGSTSPPGQLEELYTKSEVIGASKLDAEVSVALAWFTVTSSKKIREKHAFLHLEIIHCIAQIGMLDNLSDSIVSGLIEAHEANSGFMN